MDAVKEFEFNQNVADVFDDMLVRSIPFYQEIHRTIIDVIEKRIATNGLIYDLGCSTGTTIQQIQHHFPEKKLSFIGVDNSASMIKKARSKLADNSVPDVSLICQDLTDVVLDSCDLVIMNYTLQFIDKFQRSALLNKIFNALKPGGILIMAEKINCDDSSIQALFHELYYDFKRRNGYSELEISQKREALENVLIPLTADMQLELLKYSGFDKVEMLFKWYNFASFIAIK